MTEDTQNPYASPGETPPSRPLSGLVYVALIGFVAGLVSYAVAITDIGSLLAEVMSDVGNGCLLVSIFLVVLASYFDQRRRPPDSSVDRET